MKYKQCQIFRGVDRKTIFATVDIETSSPLTVYSGFENDGFREMKQMTANVSETDVFLDGTGNNVIVPNVGEFKIMSLLRKQVNAGDFKAKYRYTLTLEG